MKRKTFSKILGWGLTTGLIFASVAAIFAAPATAGEMEWTKTNTPSWEDMVILPASDIIDYDIGGDGNTVYAILDLEYDVTLVGVDHPGDLALVKSTDGGVTWSDITDNVTGAANLPDGDTDGDTFSSLVAVAVAPDDEDFLAVVGYDEHTGDTMVVASKDGGSNFSYAGDMIDTGWNNGAGSEMGRVFDIAVSVEVSDIHNIAVAGINSASVGAIYRIKAGTWLTGSWADTSDTHLTTAYPGWDACKAVIAADFSPNFDIDDTIVCLSIDDATTDGTADLQSGIWETNGSWNAEAGFGGSVAISSDGDDLLVDVFNRCVGLALPADYDGSDPGARSVFVYVNATNDTTGLEGGFVFRIDNGAISPTCGPSGDPLLASIDVHGDADTGKMMIGEYIQWDQDAEETGAPIEASCCEGVRVWHTEELDFCCPQWDGACKDPSGFYMALVMYTPDGEKEYATTSGTIDGYFGTSYPDGTPLDESAFSVSLDDAVSFNQIGLIDTDIDRISDVAVCPDCSVIYISTINAEYGSGGGDYPSISDEFTDGQCNCDSVWRSYDDGATWERVFHGDWVDDSGRHDDELLLRMPCDITEECCTVYLGVKDLGGDMRQIYYTRDCGQCWNNPPATKVDIQDIAIEAENIVYVIDTAGMVSKSTQYGRRWSDAVDTGVKSGHTISSCCNEGFVVVAPDCDISGSTDKVGWSDDGGDTWNLTDALPSVASSGEVHVACDPECENIIYAAVDGYGIFRTDITSGSWDNMNAQAIDYTGIAVARTGGTLYASSDDIIATDGDPCTTKFDGSGSNLYSGVARNLGPCETDCCGTESWDYLICGLTEDTEDFDVWTSALRICGCLSMDTNSILWAIDNRSYEVTDGSTQGTLWSYEDCAAKHGPDLTSPADEAVLDCELCQGCGASPFTLKWERMCNACSYDIMIMDEDGNMIHEWVDIDVTGDPPSKYVDLGDTIQCGTTYTWKVREANTSCECVHSPWSEIWTFTISVGASDAISLLAPDEGTLGVPVTNVGFSWTGVPDADSYTFILSPNANLTGALVSQDQGDTAYNFAGPLDYSKAYYWQVKAWKGSVLLTTSSIGVFNTMAEPVAPTPPVVVEQTPAPVIEIPAVEHITPTWIYAVIGIGAALVVVVIVLIVRTRRP